MKLNTIEHRQATSLVINPRSESLNLFSQAEILEQIGRTRLSMFLTSFADELKTAGIDLPVGDEGIALCFSTVAGIFADAHSLPQPLYAAAVTLETAASPETAARLDEIIQRRLPCISLNRNCPLDCALELWFAAPDELPQFAPARPQLEHENARIKENESLVTSAATGDAGAPAALLDLLTSTLKRFVVLPKHAAETLALWIVHTYCFQFRDVSTYIGIESPVKRCGKTTLLSVLGKLVHHPVMASNISGPAFFRVIEEEQPTLLIDEADTFLHGNDELRGILNAGYYQPNAYVIRVSSDAPREMSEPKSKGSLITSSATGNGDGNASLVTSAATGSRLVRYSCWCPKCIAAIGHLPETLADRCIVIRMQRKRGDEECERLRNLDPADLKQRCEQFATEHKPAITNAQPAMPPGLNDRACDIWEPLFAIADIAGGEWPDKARAAAIALTTGAQENSPSSTLLFDIGLAFVLQGVERFFTYQLLEVLNSRRFAGRPWTEALRGKPATEIWLAQQLRPFGVRSKALRIGDRVGKGYEFSEMQELFTRYVPASELENWKADQVKLQAANGTTKPSPG